MWGYMHGQMPEPRTASTAEQQHFIGEPERTIMNYWLILRRIVSTFEQNSAD